MWLYRLSVLLLASGFCFQVQVTHAFDVRRMEKWKMGK